MSFEYNGNLEEDKRIMKVAMEIISVYPKIELNYAKKIATLESPITINPNPIMHFKRLYNILFVMQSNVVIFNEVLEDIIKAYNACVKYYQIDGLIGAIMNQLIRYVNKERFTFPIISEFLV